MVCLMCLLPLFLVPIVNLLPRLFDYIIGKIYGVLGWEYRKLERAPPACPYNPSAKKDTKLVMVLDLCCFLASIADVISTEAGEGAEASPAEPVSKLADHGKED
ncbi:hypothetical protein TIFTF001_008464 [Ficus carica]|uniref:Uncharacterized protein n=1 Tax=Ficus carica TaxID=3494 RepID=A0AA88D2V5_FICCA|nr:hypothetical protein TIFTF001_008464 [Ficus carica]